MSLRTGLVLLVLTLSGPAPAVSQTPPPVPKPFPKPGEQSPQPPSKPPQTPRVAPPQPAAPAAPGAPTEAMLGVPVYPTAQFIASYNAGRNQRYYLFGATASFAELVAYYRTMLRQKGELVFDEPPVHIFEVGKFNEETMAFPPGVTIKDYTWNGSEGYLNPRSGGQPARFRTVIQIVPVPIFETIK